jgi:2-dehydro-3-deoxygalactonokinase
MGDLLAIDWGTTNRRIYRLSDGMVADTRRDDRGVLAMQGRDWAAEVAAIRAEAGGLPVLIAGMAGSNRGWRETPYVPAPATIAALAAGLVAPAADVWLVPGVRQDDPADVMRGEEVQLLGAVAAGLTPADALLCQPGTHCKWARMAGGAIAGFTTAMTGELFALLRGHSILADALAGDVAPGRAFDEGLARAEGGDLVGALFAIRAARALGRAVDDRAAFASGLLIGSDVRARGVSGRDVFVLADAGLGALYAAAIRHFGGRPVAIDSHRAFVAGILAIREAQ